MPERDETPKITHLSWGHMEVEGHGRFKDVKIYPGGAREWDWGETGTRHRPGVQPADVQELLDEGAESVVLGKGINERLQVMDKTVEMLREKGVDVEILQTEAAVERFNELREERAVGGLFHSTC